MHPGGYSFLPSTSGLYQGPNALTVFQPPRFINRLREFPLDLRYRPVDLTPPTTPSPSPPRKRTKFLTLDLKSYETEKNELCSRKNQFSSTISIDDKKYFQNTVESFPSTSKKQSEKLCENSDSNDFIDITSSDNELENSQDENVRKVLIENCESESNLTEDLSNRGAESDSSDEIVDIESNEDSVVFSELTSLNQIDKLAVLENGKMCFEDPKLHSKAIEGFAKLFDSSLYNVPALSNKKNSSSSQQRNKNERKRLKSRKQLEDEETTSPVSGTIIRKLHDGEELVVRKGDIDPAFNVVEVTEEAKEALALIENKIGNYICQLCRSLYEDPFGLAQHRCSRIVHIEYRCSECDKVFNCPANLASHKRWHKPRNQGEKENPEKEKDEKLEDKLPPTEQSASDEKFPCESCGRIFRRETYLKKHLISHHSTRIESNFINPTQSNVKIAKVQSIVHQNVNQRFIDFERERRRFQSFSELYFQQRSAFQYVCHQNYRNPYETLLPSTSNILRPVPRRPTWTTTGANHPIPHHSSLNGFEFPKNTIPPFQQ